MSPALAEPLDGVTNSPRSSTAGAEASRANGRKSHGPTTPEGKERSRRNGCREGLTGAGIVLPRDAAEEVDRREAAFAHDLRPRNAVERELVRQMALGAWRGHVLGFRIVQHDARMNAARFAHWVEDQRIEAAVIARRLGVEPEATVEQLRRSSSGCEWLIKRWRLLGNGIASADEGGPACTWTDADLALALDLLGRPVELRHLDDWKGRLEAIREEANQGSTEAVNELQEIIDAQINDLDKLEDELWEELEEPMLREWRTGVDIDLGPEGTRLRRYEAAADRLFRSAWNKLERLRDEDGESMLDRSARKPAAENAPPPRPAAAQPSPPPVPSQPIRQPIAPRPSQPANREVDVVDFWIAGPPQNGNVAGSSSQNKTNPAQGRPATGDRAGRHGNLL